MTVSTNSTPDLQRDQLLTAAIRQVGIIEQRQTPTPEQFDQATVHLDNALSELQLIGKVLQTSERTTLTLTSGTGEYDLPADTLNVENTGNDVLGMIVDSGGVSETVVRAMSIGDWNTIAQKTVTGRPSRAYVERHATVRIVFWPIPDANSISFRYVKTRFFRANDTGAVTMDLNRTYRPFLMYRVAAGVARDNSQVEKSAVLDAQADRYLRLVNVRDQEDVTVRFRIGHSGRNW